MKKAAANNLTLSECCQKLSETLKAEAADYDDDNVEYKQHHITVIHLIETSIQFNPFPTLVQHLEPQLFYHRALPYSSN